VSKCPRCQTHLEDLDGAPIMLFCGVEKTADEELFISYEDRMFDGGVQYDIHPMHLKQREDQHLHFLMITITPGDESSKELTA